MFTQPYKIITRLEISNKGKLKTLIKICFLKYIKYKLMNPKVNATSSHFRKIIG